MHPVSLHWFRRKQRAVARFVLAAFCLTWLQVAAMPCVMATSAIASAATVSAAPMPAMGDMPMDMVMTPGEHCGYCPPESVPSATGHSSDLCAFPHDAQVDSRVAFASALLAPPPVVVLLVPHDCEPASDATGPAAAAPPLTRTPLAVSLCRFLE